MFLSTPCYGGLCLQQYFQSIIELQMTMIKNNYDLVIDTTENESLVHRARNVSVGRFMQKTDADYFMFIDADVHFDPQSVLKLLGSGHDLSVACYPKKTIMWDQAAEGIRNGDDRPMHFLTSSLVVNFGRQRLQVDNEFIEILDGPTGFMLIKREVFKKLEDAFPELWCVNDHANRDIEKYHACFDCMIDPDSKRYLSEDYAFCRRWQKVGGKIYAHIHTTLGHVGNMMFCGSMSKRLKATKQLKNNNEQKAPDSSGDKKPVPNSKDSPHNPEN